MAKIIKILLIPLIPLMAMFASSKQKDLSGEVYPFCEALKDIWKQWWEK